MVCGNQQAPLYCVTNSSRYNTAGLLNLSQADVKHPHSLHQSLLRLLLLFATPSTALRHPFIALLLTLVGALCLPRDQAL